MNYFDLTIKNIIFQTADAVEIKFKRPNNFTFKPGQFLTVISLIDNKEVRRSYSISSSPSNLNYVSIVVKRVLNGVMSNYIIDNFKVNDVIKTLEPMGNFIYNIESNYNNVLFIAGGSGITPIFSMITNALEHNLNTNFTLIYCNKSVSSTIFKNEIDKIQNKFSEKFNVIHVLSKEDVQNIHYRFGRLTNEIISTILETSKFDACFMCGPEGMMDITTKTLHNLNFNKEFIFKESFYSSNSSTPSSQITDVKVVEIHHDGAVYKVEVSPTESILDAALDNNIDLPYSCQGGVCTACRGKALSGEVNMDETEGLSEMEIKQGYVLTCVGHPLSDNVVIEIG